MLFSTLSTLALSALLAPVVIAGPTPRQTGLQVVDNCSVQGQVALTFDDGPYNYETDIANTLNSAGGKGTFFLNGNNYGCIYDKYQMIRDLSAQQHTLASHTWSHANLATLSDADIHQELEKLETAFIKILGLKPLYFRPPYGSYNQNVLNVLAQRGYKKVFLWSDDSGDSTGASLDSQEKVLDSVAAQYPKPRMVLMHSPLDTTPEEAKYAVSKMKNAGYKMVAVDTCLGSSGEWPYEYVGQPQQPDSTWHC